MQISKFGDCLNCSNENKSYMIARQKFLLNIKWEKYLIKGVNFSSINERVNLSSVNERVNLCLYISSPDDH